MPNRQHLEVYAGTNQTVTLYARGSGNQPVSLSGKTVSWKVGRNPRNLDALAAVLTKSGTVTDAANGVFTVALTPADTQYMRGDYQHQAVTTASGGGAVEVVTFGRFRVHPQIGT